MIIDCHGHYTTAPREHQGYHDALLTDGGDATLPRISDDAIRESVEANQLRLLRERGADLTIFSPKASAMAHHVDDAAVARAWARASNDLIARVVELFPDHFAGVCQLPQWPDSPLDVAISEVQRCVDDL